MYLIQIHHNETILVLHGPGMAAPHAGARWEPCPGGDPAREELTLLLEGAPGQIEAAISALSRLLEEAARLSACPGGEWVYLEAQAQPGGETWRSKVNGGTLARARPERAGASQGLRMSLAREPWWEAAAEERLAVENGRAPDPWGWDTITNHADADAGHANWLAETGSGARGDLPAPLRLDFSLAQYWTAGKASLLAAQSVYSPVGAHQVIVEGEDGLPDGASGQITADAGCSGGGYMDLAWTYNYAQSIWRGELSGETVRGLGGRPARVLARLAEPWPAEVSEQLWVSWRLGYLATGGEFLSFLETAGAYLEAGAGFVLGPVMHVPPWHIRAGEDYVAPLALALCVQAAGTGTHHLGLDYVALAPLDGWRIYRPLTGMPGIYITDDGPAGLLRGEDGAQTHLAEGPGLYAHPGRPGTFCFYVMQEEDGTVTAPVEAEARVRMYYRPRRRML